MFKLTSRNPTPASSRGTRRFGRLASNNGSSASRLSLQTPGSSSATRKKNPATELSRGVVRRPRTGLTSSASGSSGSGAVGRLFGLRKNLENAKSGTSQGNRFLAPVLASRSEPSMSTDLGATIGFGGIVNGSRSGSLGRSLNSSEGFVSSVARRAQLWKPTNSNSAMGPKPGTSSASCRLSTSFSLPSSLGRGTTAQQGSKQEPAGAAGSSAGSLVSQTGWAGSAQRSVSQSSTSATTTPNSQRPAKFEPQPTVKLTTAACCLAHPAKVSQGGRGEDAHFFTDHAVGVADGVGGWAAHGIDAGEYARQLMTGAKISIDAGSHDPVDAMWHAYNNAAQIMGSSTCLVMILDPQTGVLQSANLGDSAFAHFRGSNVVSRAKVGQHYFNCPFQLGSHSGDDPADSLRQSVKLWLGDTIVCGSDGLFDNLFDEDILSILQSHPEDAAAAATEIAQRAQECATNVHRQGPFAQEALACGIAFQGGKLDDITCVVSQVVAQDA